MGVSRSPSNTSFLRTTQPTIPSGISIESAVFFQNKQSLTSDKWTDSKNEYETRSVPTGRLRYIWQSDVA